MTEQFVPCACRSHRPECRCGAKQRCQECGACACMDHGDGCSQQTPLGEPMPLPEIEGRRSHE